MEITPMTKRRRWGLACIAAAGALVTSVIGIGFLPTRTAGFFPNAWEDTSYVLNFLAVLLLLLPFGRKRE